MKAFYIFIFFIVTISSSQICAQVKPDSVEVKDSTLYKIITNDVNELIGFIIKNDA